MTANSLNGPKRGGMGVMRQPEYWCLRCIVQRWRAGGGTELGAHQAQHGGAVQFPHFVVIDADRYVLDNQFKRVKEGREFVPAPTMVDGRFLDGWVKSVPFMSIIRDAS